MGKKKAEPQEQPTIWEIPDDRAEEAKVERVMGWKTC